MRQGTGGAASARPLLARRRGKAEACAARRGKMAAAGRLWALLGLALAAGATATAALGKPSSVKVLSDGMWRELLEGEWMVEL